MQMNVKDMEQQALDRDRELINAVIKLQQGNANAFDTIYLHTNRFMFYKAEQILSDYYNKDSELRNDLVQDSYIKIFNNIGTLQDPAKLYGWMNTILVNTIYAYTRAHWREEFDVTNEDGDSMVEDNCTTYETPESYILEREKTEYINRSLQTLPPLQRYTVELFYFSELSVEQIAEKMDCSEGTVKSRLNYARKKLKGVIEEIEEKNKIKLHSIFALPMLLFFAKEEAMAHYAVDSASFASVREALRKECILKTNVPKGENIMNQNNTTQHMVSSVSTSIWKTALGKIIISVSIVLVSAGLITGGYFIFTNNTPSTEDTYEEMESPDMPEEDSDFNLKDLFPSKDTDEETKESSAESTETIPEESTEETVVEEPEDITSLVSEDGYIHIGCEAEGTPIAFPYKHYEDLSFYTDIRKTYFPVTQEHNIDLGYCINEDSESELLCSVDVCGAYKVVSWKEGVLVNGISYAEYKESGAKGLYLDSNVITLSLAEGTDVSTISRNMLYLQSETEYSYVMIYCDTTDLETQLAKGSIEIGEYFVQSFYTTVYGEIEKRGTVVAQTLPIPEDVMPVGITLETEYGTTLTIGLQDSNKKPLHELYLYYSEGYLSHHFSTTILNDTYYYALSELNPEDHYLLEEAVSKDFWAFHDLKANYSYQKTDDYTDLTDSSGISGRYYTSILRAEELVTNHFAPQLKAYTEAETYLDKCSISNSIFQPTLLVLLDNQYTFYICDFTYYSDFVRLSGYAVPTGNPYLLEETPLDYGFEETPKEPVIIPDITLDPVMYYDLATGQGKLKTMDSQVNTVMNYLQQEIDGEATTTEQGNAVRSILNAAKELYFIACTDNSAMKSYGDISTVSRLTDFGLDYFSSIMKRYEEKGEFMHYVNIYMGHHTGCADGRLQTIKDNLAALSGSELTKTQKTALALSKDLLDVFYDNRGNFETVITYYIEHAGKTYDADTEYYRELTDYDSRAEEIHAYWQLIPEVPGWVFEW